MQLNPVVYLLKIQKLNSYRPTGESMRHGEYTVQSQACYIVTCDVWRCTK